MALSGIKKVVSISVLTMGSLFAFQGEAVANMYKCADETGHIIYSDYPCIKTKVRSMDIMVAPVDEDSARRLRNKHGNDSSSGNSRRSSNNSSSSKKTSPKKKDPSCSYYKSQISSLQNSLKSGYTPSQGERLKQSLKDYREKYRKGCK